MAKGPPEAAKEPPRFDLNRAAPKVSFSVPRDGRKVNPAKPARKPIQGEGKPTLPESSAVVTNNQLPEIAPETDIITADKRKFEEVPKDRETMTEPPSKRSRRVDSSATWEQNDRLSRSVKEADPRPSDNDRDRNHRSERDRRAEQDRDRDSRRYRSRSRDRYERRRERSRSKERERGRDGPRERDGYGKRERERSRSRSRDRYRSRRDNQSSRPERQRDRSRSPVRNGPVPRHKSPPRGPRSDRPRDVPRDDGSRNGVRDGEPKSSGKNKSSKNADRMQIDEPGDIDADEEESMRKMMGFTSFRSTQNTKVPGNNIYGVRKDKATKYRQYMNRVGGFNRPLSPSR